MGKRWDKPSAIFILTPLGRLQPYCIFTFSGGVGRVRKVVTGMVTIELSNNERDMYCKRTRIDIVLDISY
jgi:hypothetical protein